MSPMILMKNSAVSRKEMEMIKLQNWWIKKGGWEVVLFAVIWGWLVLEVIRASRWR